MAIEGSLIVAVNDKKGRGSAGNHGHAQINTMTVKIHGLFHLGMFSYLFYLGHRSLLGLQTKIEQLYYYCSMV